MILTADIGNTNICFAIQADDSPNPVFFERIHTDREKTALEYHVDLTTILTLHGVSPATITKAAVSSVVPAVTGAVRSAMENLLFCPVLTIRHDLALGFENHTDVPSSVGCDILCDVAGAIAEYPKPLITFDMGTATVATIVSSEPALEGVLICPGVRTSLNSLSSRTSALPSIALEAPDRAIGTNTVDSMKSGIIYGTAGLIDGIIDRIDEETGETHTIVATGGLSAFIIPFCRHEILRDPSLLMKGMWHILKANEP